MFSFVVLIFSILVNRIGAGFILLPDETESTSPRNDVTPNPAIAPTPGLHKTVIPIPTCGGTFRGSDLNSGVMRSPNYPSYYPKNISCTWNIEATNDQLVYLEFDDFQLEPGPGQSTLLQRTVSCPYDVLYIYEEVNGNMAATWRQSWGFYCGDKRPRPQLTHHPGSKLVIYFHSDMSDTRKGFSGNFYFHKKDQPPVTSSPSPLTPTEETKTGGGVRIFGNSLFGNSESERFQNSFTTIVFLLVSVIFFGAIINCRKRLPASASSSSQSTNASSSHNGIRSLFHRHQTGNSNENQSAPNSSTPPPTYKDIIKTEDDLQEALDRIGTTEEELRRQRILDVEVTYSIMDENNQPRTSTRAETSSAGVGEAGQTEREHNEGDDSSSSSSWSQSSDDGSYHVDHMQLKLNATPSLPTISASSSNTTFESGWSHSTDASSLQLPDSNDSSNSETSTSESSTTALSSESAILGNTSTATDYRPTCCSPLDEISEVILVVNSGS